MDEEILVFCDGGCRGNQVGNNNVGGFGVVVKMGEKVKAFFSYNNETTNNRMELTALITAFALTNNIKSMMIKIHSDSAYCINGATDWMYKWVRNDWKRKDGSKMVIVENVDLWENLFNKKLHKENITLVKVKGHNGVKYNEMADLLCNYAMDIAENEKKGIPFDGEIVKKELIITDGVKLYELSNDSDIWEKIKKYKQ